MARKVVDCRLEAPQTGCSIRIAGEEDEALQVAYLHAVDRHEYPPTEETRAALRTMLRDEAVGSAAR